MKNSFKELKIDELEAKRAELRKKYFDLRFKKVVEHLENPVQLRNLRRQIARVETRIGAAGAAGAAGAKGVEKAKDAVKANSAAKAKSAARGVSAAAKK
jgi:large subunit ribosomal protein L29